MLLAMLLVTGCGQASGDLAVIKTARSLAAERALVAKLDAEGKLRRAYAGGMQRAGVQQLLSGRNALSQPEGAAGQAIGAAAAVRDEAGALRAAALQLARIEAQRENH